ncbi:MAG: IPT/TIG domain-containing protein [Cyclobacteriaceae bacterium]
MNNRLLISLELALVFVMVSGLLLLNSCNKDSNPVPTPTVVSISQSPISPGGSFTVTGTNLDATSSNNILKLGTVAVAVQAATITTLTATLPQNFAPGTYELSVTVKGATGKLATQVEVTPDAPSITSFTPETGPVGTAVTITGTNFDAVAANNFLTLGTTQVAVSAATTTSLQFTIPANTALGNYTLHITVKNNGEQSTTANSATDFGVLPPTPTVTSFTPAFAAGSSTMTITGTNFSTTPANNAVSFGDVTATVNAATATQLTVTIPSGLTPGTNYPISVTVIQNSVSSLTGTSSTNFALAVGIISINPTTAVKNTSLTITGTNFDPNNSIVEINGKTASITASSSTSITVTVPTGAGTGTVTVKAYSQTVNGPTLTYQVSKSYNVSSSTTFLSSNSLYGIQSISLDTVNNKLYVGAEGSISWPAGVYAYSTTDGSYLGSLSTYVAQRLAVGGSGTVYESGGLSVRNDTQSAFVKYNGGGSNFSGIAYRNGLLYTTTSNQLVTLDPTQASPTPVVVNTGLPQYVIGFAMDKSATTCYMSNNWATLDKLDVASGNITHLLTSLSSYYSIATDNVSNNIYFTSYQTNSGVYIYDQDQQMQVLIGQIGGNPVADLAVRYTSSQITVYVSDINGYVHKILVDTPVD